MEIIKLGDIKVSVLRSAKRKSLAIEIGHSGVKARAPLKMRLGTIEKFVQKKQQWIEKHLSNLPEPTEPLALVDGVQLKLFDQTITLDLLLGLRGVVQLDQGFLQIPIIQTNRPLQASLKDKLIRWYKQQAQATLQKRILRLSKEMNINLPTTLEIKVRDYKRRWGSCNHKGNLSFNWRIIMAPEDVINYVVVHELAHLKEFNHSRRFWQIVEQQMPDWEARQDWLSDNGTQLYRL